jgi:WYL domain-containing protein
MATSPSPLSSMPGGAVPGMNPPPGWAIRMAQLMQQNQFAKALAPAGKAVQAAQSAVGQAGDSFVNYMANRTPNQAPANQQLMSDVMKAGPGLYGMPMPTAQKAPPGTPLESVVAPEDEGVPLAFAKAQGIKIPKGQQKDEVINKNIETAATGNKTMLMTYQNPEWDSEKVYHLEPYSYRDKNGKPVLYAYDRTGKGIRYFDMDNIINVTPTEKTFTPQVDAKSGKPWPVEIGQKPSDSATLKSGSSTAKMAGNVPPDFNFDVGAAVRRNPKISPSWKDASDPTNTGTIVSQEVGKENSGKSVLGYRVISDKDAAALKSKTPIADWEDATPADDQRERARLAKGTWYSEKELVAHTPKKK